MNPEFKEAFCTALESDQYPQGEGWLERGGKFCCLGVARKVAINLGMTTSSTKDDSTLSVQDLHMLGVTVKNSCVLMSMNDSEKKSFKEIAAYIRENL